MKSKGVVFIDTIATYDYGKFVRFIDPEGNKIELWEPVDSVLTKMGGVTNK
jgi:predicted enzyme related to lactoylglutathione lyase